MIVWAILLLGGLLCYFYLKRESSAGHRPISRTIRSLAMAFLVMNLMAMIFFNGRPITPVTYFMLGVGTMAVIGIVVETVLAQTQK
ncbi:hypothetical protein CHL76_08460 [Marinococcus halophilus]|uniref:Uncharacterized protein n=1 Tax=Marinococcus halophilus TaxID=1371 RepID=A0A510Y4B9_MARHA|nr:hypothetical protein [Marinococcus halophilus]OZT80130.1 hypothetical protein CHL76_08460 [Marinococcus halophilus]GEK58178.1 hypothetical protein MHA01_10830 [Marinococcus halophilus]